jgi:hypothetical protein
VARAEHRIDDKATLTLGEGWSQGHDATMAARARHVSAAIACANMRHPVTQRHHFGLVMQHHWTLKDAMRLPG